MANAVTTALLVPMPKAEFVKLTCGRWERWVYEEALKTDGTPLRHGIGTSKKMSRRLATQLTSRLKTFRFWMEKCRYRSTFCFRCHSHFLQ